MKEVEINYRVEKKEFVNHRMRMLLKPRNIIIFGFFIILLLSFKFIVPLISPGQNVAPEQGFISIMISVLPLIIVPILIVLYLRYQFKKVYDNTADFQQDVKVVMDENGYFGKSASSEGRKDWSAIHKIIQQKEMLDIYFSKQLCASIPMRFVSSEKIKTLKQILNKAQVNNNL
ncbi:YcxB family protein [Nonlabens sp. Asnod2-A12]|uniref:YcxB family protein n=1 Tax=Nonlabens sp. Asnod2-A12 TaxID=3160578 RepID=UPI003863EFD6